jgi:hypothetical protein
MRHLLRLVFLVVLALCAAPRPAEAKPMSSTLAEVRAGSPTVLVATFVDGVGPPWAPMGYVLQVEKALVGSASAGLLHVGAVPGEPAYPTKGARIVAFLDPGGALKYAATLRAGPTLEEGVLRVEGFYTSNAHLVTPGLMTLPQLVRYLKTGALEYVFRGKLHVLVPGKPAAAPSSIDLTVWRDAVQGTSTVTGMPAIRGLPAGPDVWVGDGLSSELTLAWNRGWPRPLVVEGEPTGVDPATGAIQARFWVETPVGLTEAELRRYLADDKVVATYHLATLSVAGVTRTIALGTPHVKIPDSRTAPLIEIGAMSLSPVRYLEGPGVRVDLDPRAPGLAFLGRGWVEGDLVQELMAGPVGCTVRWKWWPPARCSLSLGSTLLATR